MKSSLNPRQLAVRQGNLTRTNTRAAPPKTADAAKAPDGLFATNLPRPPLTTPNRPVVLTIQGHNGPIALVPLALGDLSFKATALTFASQLRQAAQMTPEQIANWQA